MQKILLGILMVIFNFNKCYKFINIIEKLILNRFKRQFHYIISNYFYWNEWCKISQHVNITDVLEGFDTEFIFINEEVNVHLSSVNQLIYTCTI